MTHDGKLGCKMSPNDENEQLSTRSDKFELGKGTPSELCRVSNLSDFGAEASLPHPVLSFKLMLRASGISAFSWRYYLLSGQK